MRDFTQSKKFPQHDGNGGNQCSDTVAEFGRLDAAFNNAGVMARIAPTADSTRDEWERVIGTNLRGVWSSRKYELREMQPQGSGAIVNKRVSWGTGWQSRIGSYIGGSSD